jgi:hypothetical protein
MAVFVLVMLGGLVAAMFWVGVAEQRAGRATLGLQAALGTAERAAMAALSDWDVSRHNAMVVGATAGDPDWRPAGEGSTARIQRLSETLFLIVATGSSGTAVQTLGLLARLELPSNLPSLPLLATGPTVIAPTAEVHGPESELSKAGCTSLRAGEAGPKFGDSQDPADGLVGFADWVARATKVVPPGHYAAPGPSRDSSRCRTEAPGNWGDPLGGAACRDFRPVVLVPGDLTVVGGAGQGVLLVEGDFTVRGGFVFEGLVLVGGSMVTGGGASRFVGAVQAGILEEGGVELGGRARVVYSRCSLESAALAAGRPLPMVGGAWIYGIE